jgi:hypothetical protein
MGEGDCTKESREEMMLLVKKVKEKGFKSCLYSGRDCSIEDWMEMFDYIKLGSYKKEYGDLFEETTNQRMYMKTSTGYQNITNMFRYL